MTDFLIRFATEFLPIAAAIFFLAQFIAIIFILRQPMPMDPNFEPVDPAMIGMDARPTLDWYDYFARAAALDPIVTFTSRKLPHPNLCRVYLSRDHLVMAEAMWVNRGRAVSVTTD